jgi:hypothetical protein
LKVITHLDSVKSTKMKQLNDNFNFFVDEVTLEKAGKDAQGRDLMKIGGIATTKAKDTDGEEIDEKGWDTDYFVNSGFFNYNHQSKFNPKAVIGEPTSAKVTKDGVYVEGYLYSDSDLAKSVYDTTKMLEGSSSKRRMGFSIEGKALERDSINPKKITKARLTGCALTLNPKNPNTLVNIMKGDYHDDDYSKGSNMSIEEIMEMGSLAKGKDPCWDGYEQLGTKEKNGKNVPNCIPEDVEKAIDSEFSDHEVTKSEDGSDTASNGETKPSTRKGKKAMIYMDGKWYHFGDSSMKHNYSDGGRERFFARHASNLKGDDPRAKAFRVYAKKYWKEGGSVKTTEKSLDTASSGAPLMVEDVDQNLKNKIDPSKEPKYLSKGEVFSSIFDYIYDADIEKADMMYSIIEATAIKRIKMENNIDKVKDPQITKGDLQKSLDIILGVVSDGGNDLFKGKSKKELEADFEDQMSKAKCDDEEYQSLKKACSMSKKALEEYEGKIEKGEISGYPATPGFKNETMISDENASSIGKEGNFIKKSNSSDEEGEEDPEMTEEEEGEEVEKSKKKHLKKTLSTTQMMKSLSDSMEDNLEKGFGQTNDLIKSLAEVTQAVVSKNDDLEKGLELANEANDTLASKLEKAIDTIEQIGSAPYQSKSVTSQNYSRHPSLEKSINSGASAQLHLGRDKQQILDILDRKADLGGSNPNMAYAQAMQHLESSNLMEKGMANDLLKSEGVEILGV